MKKVLLLLLVLLVASFFGCAEDEGSEYYIKCKIDGVSYTWNHGILDAALGDDNPIGGYQTADTATYMYALKSGYSLSSTNAPVGGMFMIGFPGSTTGTFDETDNAGMSWLNAAGDDFDSSFIDIVVTNYGAVGDSIDGTFSGTLDDGGSGMIVTEGSFHVLRLANDSMPD